MTTSQIARGLDRASFAALRAGEICAIEIEDLIHPNACENAAEQVRARTGASSYRWSDDLTILGVSIGEAHESEDTLERYLTGGAETSRIIREEIFGGVTPIDKVALRLLELWEAGIRVPQLKGRRFLQQVLRRWKQGGGANPHLDQSRTPLLAPFGIERRFGINVYLEMPSEGGAIEFWRRRFSEDEYKALREPAPSYGLSRALVGDADLKLRPRAGQAFMFDASRPHAVEAVSGRGERITNASFFAHAGDDRALFQFA